MTVGGAIAATIPRLVARRAGNRPAPTPQTIWLLLDRGEVSVCHQHPGFDSDAVITSTTADLADVFQGYRTWATAVAEGRIDVSGPRRLTSAIPRWFAWSPWSDVTAERSRRAGVAG